MVEWRRTPGLTDYDDAVAQMEARADAIARGEADELIWLVEHPPLYTAGTSAKIEDLVDPDRFPVYASKRGGQYTYTVRGNGWPMPCLMWASAARTCANSWPIWKRG